MDILEAMRARYSVRQYTTQPLSAAQVQRLQEEMAHCGSEIAVAEVPLLFECGWQDAFDETWVVAADEDILIARLKGRGVSEQEARRRLAAQMSQEEKIALCDVVLYNNADRESLKRQVLSCLERHR